MNEMFGGRQVVVKALVGSHNYNINTPASDKDWKYFVAPTFSDLYNGNMFSNAKQSEELDYSVHDVRQLGNLIWKSNINFIEVLFSKEVEYDPQLAFLWGLPNKYACANLPAFYNATMGMHKQKLGNLHKGTSKTLPMVEKIGYDPKEACHSMRCLYTLQKYAATSHMEMALWFEGSMREHLIGLKNGVYTEEQFLDAVNVWHNAHGVWVGEFFEGTTPKPEVKEELEEKMFYFVKSKMLVE